MGGGVCWCSGMVFGFFWGFLCEGPGFCLFCCFGGTKCLFSRPPFVLVIFGRGVVLLSGNIWKLWLELCISIGLDAGYNWYVLPRWALDVGRPDMAMRLALACSSQDAVLVLACSSRMASQVSGFCLRGVSAAP